MQDIVRSSLCAIAVLCQLQTASAQSMQRFTRGKPVVCYYHPGDRLDHILPSERFRKSRQSGAARVKTATFEVEYINFPDDNLAREAFQYAVEIWESTLFSSIPIRIRAEWRDLEDGVLGQALWGSAFSNFGGEQHQNIFYPVALAEKISRKELNLPSDPDIVASFNENISWYYGLDANTPGGKMDLVTIVLHEIGHGLGFTDSYDVKGQDGTVGLSSSAGPTPFIFDLFVEDASGDNLLHDFDSPSKPLAAALESTNLFFGGQMSATSLNGVKPELFAPATFDNGSSISHLDESTFNAAADANRLMTPQIAFAESIHDPGNLLLAMFSDMGWVYTNINHQSLKDTERMDGEPYKLTATILSDNGYISNQVKLHYTTDGVHYTTVNMASTGNADEYAYSLPGRTSAWACAYYISVKDSDNRTFTSPGKIQAPGQEPEQGNFYFRIGPDKDPPLIVHTPVTYVSEGETRLRLDAVVTDNLGVEEVVVEYFLESGVIKTAMLQKTSSGDDYRVDLDIPMLQVGDKIQYRIVARDQAGVENSSRLPGEGFYLISVNGILPVKDSYVNNFNESSFDFFGNEFTITTPAGFVDGSIHSNHPYPDGSGPASESSFVYQLQIPIRIDALNPVIQFDEIVLVEPGEEGSKFGGSGFFDYVVVEGSIDGGNVWKPFAPGYDSRDYSVWLSRYNANVLNFNSQAQGTPDAFRERKINMLENGNFLAGDEVLIRFRLFADQLAHGWGWAIDNLSIQGPVTNTERPTTTEFEVYPVPVQDELFIALNVRNNMASIQVVDIHGKVILSKVYSQKGEMLTDRIDVSLLSDGMYFLKARVGDRLYVRKFIKAHP